MCKNEQKLLTLAFEKFILFLMSEYRVFHIFWAAYNAEIGFLGPEMCEFTKAQETG